MMTFPPLSTGLIGVSVPLASLASPLELATFTRPVPCPGDHRKLVQAQCLLTEHFTKLTPKLSMDWFSREN